MLCAVSDVWIFTLSIENEGKKKVKNKITKAATYVDCSPSVHFYTFQLRIKWGIPFPKPSLTKTLFLLYFFFFFFVYVFKNQNEQRIEMGSLFDKYS